MKFKRVALIALSLFFCGTLSATNYIWTGAHSTNWNDALNWSPASIPSSTDNVTITKTGSNNLSIEISPAIVNFTVSSGNTVNLLSGNSLTVNGNFTNSGTFTGASSSTLYLGGTTSISGSNISLYNLTINSGASISCTATLSISGAFSNAGYFSASSGNITFNGSSPQTIGTGIFYNLYISTTNNATVSMIGNVTVNAQLYPQGSTGNLVVGTNTLTFGTSFAYAGAHIDATNAGATIVIPNSMSLSMGGFVSGVFNNLTINNNATLTGSASYTINGVLTIANGSTLNMGTNAIIAGASFSTSGTGTLQTQSTSSTPLPSGKSYSFDVLYNSASAQIVVGANYNNLNISGGNRTLSNSTGTIAVAATYTQTSGTLTTTGSTLSLGTSTTLIATTYGTLIAAGGTITAPSTLTLTGGLTINNGASFTAPSGTLSIAGSFTNSGTLNPNNGNVTFNGSSAQTIPAINYFAVTINNSANVSLGGNVAINGGLTLTTGNLTIGGNALTITGGTITNTSGHIDATNTSATIILSTSMSLSSTVFTGNVNNLTVNNNATVLAQGNYTVNGILTIASGAVFNMQTYSLTAGASFSTSGTGILQTQSPTTSFYPTTTFSFIFSFTVLFNGVQAQSLPKTCTFNNLILSNAAGVNENYGLSSTVTVNGQLTINNGCTLSMGTATLAGSFSTSGTGILQTKSSIPSGITYTFEVDYNSTFSQTVVNGNYTNLNLTGGFRTFSNSGTISVSGTLITGSGPFTTTGSTISFNDTLLLPNIVYNNLIIAGGIMTTPTSLTIMGNLTIESGATFIAPSDSLSMAGNFSNYGTFTHNGGTVLLNGGNQVLSGTTTFNNFSKLVTNAATLTFPSSQTQTFINNLTLIGVWGNALTVKASTTGQQAYIAADSTKSTWSNLSVSDINNTNSLNVLASKSKDNGDNRGITFTQATYTLYDTILANATSIINQINIYPNAAATFTSSVIIGVDTTINGQGLVYGATNVDNDYMTYLNNIYSMVIAFTNPNNFTSNGVSVSCYNKAAVYNNIVNTLTYWTNHAKYYTTTNWFNGYIGCSTALSEILVLMRGYGVTISTPNWNTKEQYAISGYLNKSFTNYPTYAKTGANLQMWSNWLVCVGGLTQQKWYLDSVAHFTAFTLDYTRTGKVGVSDSSGLMADNGYLFHSAQLYISGYGFSWISCVYKVANYFKNTSYALSQSQLDIAFKYLHYTYFAASRGMTTDYSLRGRSVALYGTQHELIDTIYAHFALLVDTVNRTLLQSDSTRFKAAVSGNANYAGDTTNTHYWTCDYTLHKRPNYMFSVRSVSTRTVMSEGFSGLENRFGTFFSDGANCIMTKGTEYRQIYPTWNWNYVPGVTTLDSIGSDGLSATAINYNDAAHNTKGKPDYGQPPSFGSCSFVGGVSNGKFGASVYTHNHDGVKANKAWFFFDSLIVCLGNGITSSKNQNIVTSVNQCLSNGTVIYNQSGVTNRISPNAAKVTASNINWVWHDSIGYYFPAGGNVSIRDTTNTGDWAAIDSNNVPNIVSNQVFLLSFSHGVNPTAASYQYFVMPGIDSTTFKSMNPANSISVLSNTPSIMAVKNNGLKSLQIIFDSASTISDTISGIKVSVSKPCALLISNIGQRYLAVSVSDPSQSLASLNIAFSYHDSTKINQVQTILPNGLFTGSTVSFIVDTTVTTASWTGSVSTDFYNASNWQNNIVPDSTTNILIASGLPRYPVLNTGVRTIINTLTIQSGSAFTVNNTDTLQINGSISNSGIVTVNGTASYNGNLAQTIAANTFLNNTVNNLLINNAAGVTLAGTLSIKGTLTPQMGTLNTGGFLILNSDSISTARIGIVTGTIVGNVTVQRYIPSKVSRKYSFIGSSVLESVRDGWQKQIYLTGNGSGGTICGLNGNQYNSNGFDVTQTNSPTMFTYHAVPVNGSRWVSIPNTTNTNLLPGIGYKLNIRGNRSSSKVSCINQLTSLNPTAPEAVTLSTTGTITTGDLNITLNDTAANKYTLLANPYPCQISFASFQGDNANLNNKMWTYSPFGNGNYTTLSQGIVVNAAAGYDNTSGAIIASGQAFFVEANANGNVTFHEMHKSNSSIPNTKYFDSTNDSLIRIGLMTPNQILLDETVIRINSNGKKQYAPTIDAESFNSAAQTLAILKGNNRIAIATYPNNQTVDTISLSVSSTAVGAYQLSLSDFQPLLTNNTITLMDNFFHSNQNISINTVYGFNITSDTSSQGNNRFKIVITKNQTLPVRFTEVTVSGNRGEVALNWKVTNELNLKGYQVQRSVDGFTFNTINEVAVINKGSYSYKDFNIPSNDNVIYYRIQAFDEDGKMEVSKVVSFVLPLNQLQVSLFPNPLISSSMTINIINNKTEALQLNVLDAMGRKVFGQVIMTNCGSTSTPITLTSGVFYLLLNRLSDGVQVFEKGFIKGR